MAVRWMIAFVDPPIAIITTHPLVGLERIVRLWRDRIHASCPGAELHIYSAAIYRAMQGKEIDDRLNPIFEAVRDASADGVGVRTPLEEAGMAAAFRKARVHLYPSSAHEMYGSTLAESQAVGLPAVVWTVSEGGGAQDRVRNGQTGYNVPDEDAFGNVAVEILNDKSLYETLSRDAQTMQAGRGWDAAAIEFEALWSKETAA